MGSDTKLIEQLRAQRTGRVEVIAAAPGRTAGVLLVRRPSEATELPRYARGMTPAMVIECVVGWDGLTQADLLGASVGASDPAPYSTDLCAEVMADRAEWVSKACDWLVQSITTHINAKEAVQKN